MKWSLSEVLRSHRDDPLQFDETLDLKADLMARYPEEVLDLTPVHTVGSVTVVDGAALVVAHVTGTLTVPSSRSLDPVPLPFAFDMDEFYVASQGALQRFEKTDVVIVATDDTIDFDKAVGDNILLQIPMQILSADERAGKPMPNGQDWQVVSEVDEAQTKADNKKVDPRLAKLKDFFPDQEDK